MGARSLIAKVFADPIVQALVHTEIIGHADWVAPDRGTLPRQEAIRRAVQRMGLAEAEVAACCSRCHPRWSLSQQHSTCCIASRHRAHAVLPIEHACGLIEHLEQAYTFWDVFTGVVISCRLHLCKPEPAIYACLLETYGLDGANTVFIDYRKPI